MGNISLFSALQGAISNSGPFDPSKIGNLTFWLHADSLTLSDGDAVTSWADSSRTGTVLTNSDRTAPIYKANIMNGKPVVRFSNANGTGLLGTTLPNLMPSATCTVMAVFNSNNTGDYQFLFNYKEGSPGGDNDLQLGLLTSSPGSTTWNGYYSINNVAGTFTTPYGTPAIGGYSSTGTVGTGYLNGTVENTTTFSATTAGAGRFYLGYREENNHYFDGDLAEIVVYNRALSPMEIAQITYYFAEKYGISPIPNSGLFSWFKTDALTGLSSGSNVITWPDSSGNGNTAVHGTAGPSYFTYNPSNQNGLPSVSSIPTSYMTVPSGLPTSSSIFVVAKGTIAGANDGLISTATSNADYTDGDPLFMTQFNATQLTTFNGSNGYNTVTSPVTNINEAIHVFGYTLDTTASHLNAWVDGVSAITNAAYANNGNNAVIQLASGGGGPFSGYLYEYLIYNRALNANEIAAVTSYLRTKWGF